MKILRLNLQAFGPFTDQVLDFAAGHEGLHVVYGPNEAGKSSALRALWQLLYGIPGNSRDNFIHPHGKLRIGAALRRRDGTIVECLRRKGTKNTLLDASDEQPLPPQTLSELLGGIEQAEFCRRFGLGHEELVAGGRAIVEGSGELGEVLFAAGSGIATLGAVRRRLETDANELFSPRGQKPRINAALRELKETRKRIKTAQLPSTEWVRLDEAVKEARAARERIDSDLRDQSAQKERLKRIAAALPVIAQQQLLLEQFEPVRDAVPLADDFGEQRRAQMREIEVAGADRREAKQSLELIDRAVGETSVSSDILDHADAIEEVFQEVGSNRKAAKDRPGLVAEREHAEREAEKILLELGGNAQLANADRLRLSPDKRARIQELGAQYQALVEKQRTAQQARDEIDDQIEQLERESLDRLTPPDASALRQTIRRAQKQGDVDRELAQKENTLRGANEQLAKDLERLPQWSGTLEQLETLPVPPSETIDRYDGELEQLATEVKSLQDRVLDCESRGSEIDTEMAALDGEREVPTEEDLRAARARRDTGWRLVRSAIDTGVTGTDEIRAFIEIFPPSRDLWQAFEMSIEQADATADRLRAEADRVARKATLTAERQRVDETTRGLNTRLRDRQAKHEQTKAAWSELWKPVGVEALSPREMRAWTARQQQLAAGAATARQLQHDVTACQNRIDSMRSELADRLAEMERDERPASNSLAAMIDHCEAVCDAIDAERDLAEQQERDRNRLQNDQAKAERQCAAAEKAISRWRQEWADAISHVALEPDATPVEANAVMDRIQTLFAHIEDAGKLQTRIKGIDRDGDRFAEDIQTLVARVAGDLAKVPPELAAAELNTRLTNAREANAKRLQLNERRAKENQKLEAAEEALRQAESTLAALMKEARCTSPDELAAAEAASRGRREIEGKLAECNDRLGELAGGALIEKFVGEAQSVDRDQLPYLFETLEGGIDELNDEKSKLDQTIGGLKRDLDAIDGGATAAEADEDKEQMLAAIRADAEEYARLQLATAVLRDAIERYRQEHQGPLLHRASELFAELTLGSFSGLRVDYDEKDNAVLGGVRSGGEERVLVDGMSDGTCDQLYLALRLAGIETFLAENEPIPLVIDDVLMRFDDARASAALKALARLSEKTQVIYFTHHAHLLNLAEEIIDDDVLIRHDLDCRRTSDAAQKTPVQGHAS